MDAIQRLCPIGAMDKLRAAVGLQGPAPAVHCALLCDRLAERTDATWEWDLCSANGVEIRWLVKALPSIVATAEECCGVRIRCAGHCLEACGDVHGLRATIRDFFGTPGVIDYASVIAAVGRGVCTLVIQHCNFISAQNKKALEEFTASPIVPFGIPEYEVSFAAQTVKTEAGGLCHTLVYPDLNGLTHEHVSLMEQEVVPELQGRPHLHHLVRCFTVVSHEVLHFIQSSIDLRDESPLSWAAEHDASWPSLSLLAAVDRAGLCPALSPGLVEACVVYMHRNNSARMDACAPEVLEAYRRWQAHCGLTGGGGGDGRPATFGPGGVSPDDAAFNATFRMWKETLALEGLVWTEEALAAQLSMMFAWGGRREGAKEVNALPHPAEAAEGAGIPAEVLPANQVGRMLEMGAPVGMEGAERVTRALER